MKIYSALAISLGFLLLLSLNACATDDAKQASPEERLSTSAPSPDDVDEDIDGRQQWLRRRRIGSTPQARWLLQRRVSKMQGKNVQWINLGPMNVSGRILSHAFDPDNSQIVWVGSAGGGLWKSTNGGDSWRPMTDSLLSLAVSAIAINPKNTRSMLIGTGEGYDSNDDINGAGAFRSNDGGQRWRWLGEQSYRPDAETAQDPSIDGYSLAWDPEDTTIVHYATNRGVFRSTDGGFQDWRRTLRGKATSLVINSQNPEILYTVIEYPDSAQAFADPDSVGLFRSRDRGQTWEQLQAFLDVLPRSSLSEMGNTRLAISPSQPEVVYVGAARKKDAGNNMLGFYKTRDGGETWEKIIPRDTDGNTLDLYCNSPDDDSYCLGRFANVVAVSPFDPARVFAGGVNLYRSDNGGSTWYKADSTGQLHADQHDFAFDPTDSTVVYVLSDGGVYQSSQGGDPNTWTAKNDSLVTLQIYYAASAADDIDWVAAGAQDQGAQHLDGGFANRDWNELQGGDGLVVLIDPTDKNIIYGETQNGYLWRTLDGGQNVYNMTQRGAYYLNVTGIAAGSYGLWATPLVMNPENPHTLYTSTQDSVFKMTNANDPDSVRWQRILQADSISQLAIDRVDTAYVYAYSAAAGNTFYRSTDAGHSWNPTQTSPGNYLSDLEADPDRQGVLYATRSAYGETSRVVMSTDAGDTWADISGALPDVAVQTIALTPASSTRKKQLYIGTDIGVFATLDGVYQWIKVMGNLPFIQVYDMHFHPIDETIRIATYGRGLWKMKVPRLEARDFRR